MQGCIKFALQDILNQLTEQRETVEKGVKELDGLI